MICRRNVLTGQLLDLCKLCLLCIELIRLDFHTVFQQRHLSGITAALPPSFTEGIKERFALFVIPWLYVRRSCQIRIEAPGRAPDFRTEPVSLYLFVQRLPEGRNRRLVSARIAR